jgi:hypothetical protein
MLVVLGGLLCVRGERIRLRRTIASAILLFMLVELAGLLGFVALTSCS